MKRFLCLLTALALLTLSGCSARVTSTDTARPLSDAPSRYPAPHGDDSLTYEATVALYLPSLDQQRLLAQYDTVTLSRTEIGAEAVARLLLAHPGNDQVTALAGDVNISLYGQQPVEVSGGVCTVNLASSALRLSADEFYTLCLGLSSTLCQLDGIQYVNVLVANQPVGLDIAGFLPMGTLAAHPGEVLPSLWEQMYTRRTPLGRDAAQMPLNATATLYFPLRDASGFMAETRNLSFSGQTPSVLATGLLNALSAGALYLDDACDMPDFSTLLMAAPETSELADGSRMITLYFMPDVESRLSALGIDPACFTGALTYTLTSFIPSVTAVRMQTGATLLTTLYSPALGAMNFQNGIQRRTQYASALREHVTIYLASGNRLRPVSRTISSIHAKRPQTLAALLMEGPTEAERQAGLSPTLPAGFDATDVLGVGMVGDTLLLNLSERFGHAIRAQIVDEQLLCYSLVTTLCEAHNLRRVRFYFAGDMEQTMDGQLWWGGEFLLNRMLVQ